ncbi:MAG: Baf family transcriptional acitvator [Bacteroidetes bacterium OLB12]|nr:MAG: Baf family transcriptional acitvator [Bacteroidetes bacterium OLB12]HNR73657.1 type III pantothenate kinase [Cyclobacteriaceae bacterium]HNU41429.1 type III pantothenate kinase [Cyclobacteriaceae bacterium]
MLLALDIGNSDITVGLWKDNAWKHVWRISSRPDLPELYYGVKIRDYFFESGNAVDQVKTIVLSSVVPAMNDKLKNVSRMLFEKDPVVLGPKVYASLPMQILNPFEIGSDLVANAAAAYFKYKRACIVVDFGTALTFTTVSAKGEILGVSIAPGLRTAVRALSQNTAKLFDVPLEMPTSPLGKNTITAIQSGVLFGYEGLVKNVVSHIQAELKVSCIVVATGGLSSIIAPLTGFFHSIEPNLTLDGLRLIGEHVST